MSKEKRNYIFLIKRYSDNKLFCSYGNFKRSGYRPVYLFPLVTEKYKYSQKTPFGDLLVSNISCDLKYNSKEYHVIRQMAL